MLLLLVAMRDPDVPPAVRKDGLRNRPLFVGL